MRPAIASLILLTLAMAPAHAAGSNAFLCHAQLDMLVDRDRVTAEEQAVFDKQCACLEEQEKRTGSSDLAACSQGNLG